MRHAPFESFQVLTSIRCKTEAQATKAAMFSTMLEASPA